MMSLACFILATACPEAASANTGKKASAEADQAAVRPATKDAVDERQAKGGESKDLSKEPSKDSSAKSAKPAATQKFSIDDFAVLGADRMPQIDLEEAIYPFMGPDKTADDVEKARAALEKSYHDKGYQTVSVSIPPQNVQGGVVKLKVSELKVGRLRVRNAKFSDLQKIKEDAPSLKEGTVPNFNDVTKDIVSLNQLPDRRVTPALRAGVAPGTVDVDLTVEDKFPLHANVELNNRQSPSTTPYRASATLHYDNLWQLGHSFSFTYQVAPQRSADAEVYSASYLARIPHVDWLNILAYGFVSRSNLATIGGVNIIGPGEVAGTRAVITLPTIDKFYHSVSVGPDYKHFDQTVVLGGSRLGSPVTYYPIVTTYNATYQAEKSTTVASVALTSNLRPVSTSPTSFDNRRFLASPSFTHINFDVSHTQELDKGFQAYGHLSAQKSDGPLVSSEQFAAGGLDTVRGYLESETLGDDGIAAQFEARTPDLAALLKEHKDKSWIPSQISDLNEWRIFAFADVGQVSILKALPEQQASYHLASYGIGTRFKIYDGFNGQVIGAVPTVTQAYSRAGSPRILFRAWGEF